MNVDLEAGSMMPYIDKAKKVRRVIARNQSVGSYGNKIASYKLYQVQDAIFYMVFSMYCIQTKSYKKYM